MSEGSGDPKKGSNSPNPGLQQVQQNRRRTDQFEKAGNFVTEWLKKQEEQLASHIDDLDQRAQALAYFSQAKARLEFRFPANNFHLCIHDPATEGVGQVSLRRSVQVFVYRPKPPAIESVSFRIRDKNGYEVPLVSIANFDDENRKLLKSLLDSYPRGGNLSAVDEHAIVGLAFQLCGLSCPVDAYDPLKFDEYHDSLKCGYETQSEKAKSIDLFKNACLGLLMVVPVAWILMMAMYLYGSTHNPAMPISASQERSELSTTPSSDSPPLKSGVASTVRSSTSHAVEAEAEINIRVAIYLSTLIALSTMGSILWLVHISAKFAKEEWRAASRYAERITWAKKAQVNILTGNFQGFQHDMEQLSLPSAYTHRDPRDEE